MNTSGTIGFEKKSRVGVIIAIVIGVLFCIGLLIALVYLGITKLRQLEFQPRTSCPDVPVGWKQIASEPLVIDVNKWPTLNKDDEYGVSHWQASDNKYRGFVHARQAMINSIHPDFPIVEDFYWTVDVQKTAGPAESYYGIAFHMSHHNRYIFVISDTQEYEVKLYKGRWVRLIDWTEETIIKPGSVNKFTVLAEGSHYVLCINNVFVVDFYDDQKPRGFVGFVIGVENANEEVTVEVDNFNLFVP